MHNFVYLAQRRIQGFFCEPNFGGGACPRPLAAPLAVDTHVEFVFTRIFRSGIGVQRRFTQHR